MASSPKVSTPDPVATANAQTATNVETAETQARLNRLDETNPLGTVRFNNIFDQQGFDAAQQNFDDQRNKIREELGLFSIGSPLGDALVSQIPLDGRVATELKNRGFEQPDAKDFERFERVTELNPTAQATFDEQQQLGLALAKLASDQTGRVGEAVGQPFTFDGLPVLPAADADARNEIENALFEREAVRLRDRFSDANRSLETQLANQGIQRGTELFDRELFNLRKAENDAFNFARQNAIAGAAQEQNRLFNLQSGAREQALRERIFQRQLPLNETAALLSGSQVQIPDFGPTSPVGVAPTNLIGAVNAAQQSRLQNAQNIASSRNANVAAAANFGGGLAGGIGAAGGLAAFF